MLSSRILSLSFQNIRSFGEDTFHAPSKKGNRHTDWPSNKMIILQMPNGTAKTTIIDLVTLAFTGEIPDAETASSFKRINGSSKGNSDETSMFKIRMEINEEVYAFTLFLNHENKDYYWETTNKESNKKGWHPPREINDIFAGNSQLAQLFIMDLETRDSILNRSGKSLIKGAIREFGGLASTYRLIGKPHMGQFSGGTIGGVKQYLESKIGVIDDDKEKSRIEKRDAETEEKLGERIAYVRAEVDVFEKRKIEISSELNGEGNEGGLISELKKLESKHEKGAANRTNWKTKMKDLETEIERKADDLEKILINPRTNFSRDWSTMRNFHMIHEKAGLPGPVGKQFIKKISNSEKCICGTEIEEVHRKHMKENIDQWIDRKQITAVTNMQYEMLKDVTTNFNREADVIANNITSLRDDLIEATSEYDKTYEDELEKERRDSLKDQIGELEGELDRIKKSILIRTTTNKTDLVQFGENENGLNSSGKIPEKPSWTSYNLSKCQNIPILMENLEVLKKKIEDSSEYKQTFDGLRDFRKIVGNALLKVTDDLSYQINKDAINMWKNSPALAAEPAGFDISYMDENVKFFRGDPPMELPGNAASGAQKLMACYSLSVSLTRNGNISMPFIGDTPFTGVDEDGQLALAKEISSIFTQSIFLINTQEKLAFKELQRIISDEWLTKRTHRICIWASEKDVDGGKLCEYSEDIDLWSNLTGNTFIGGDK